MASSSFKEVAKSKSSWKEPLDKLLIITHKDGRDVKVPALHQGWAEKIEFLDFVPFLPFGENIDLESWMERTQFLVDDLTYILKLEHSRFWSQLIYDQNLSLCLESCLKNFPRPFDCGLFKMEEPADKLLKDLMQCVYYIFLRCSTYKESKDDHITPSKFGDLIYEHYVFDITKMMDICVIYGEGNGVMVRKMLENIFTTQSQYFDDLSIAVRSLQEVFDQVRHRVGIERYCGDDPVSPNTHHIASLSHSIVKDVLLFIVDTAQSILSFTNCYPPVCDTFYSCDFALSLPQFFDDIIPGLQLALQNSYRSASDDDKLSIQELNEKLALARRSFVHIFRNIVTHCAWPIGEKNCDSKRVNDFLEVFDNALDNKHFICDYQFLFPIEDDLKRFEEAQTNIDPVRLDYIVKRIRVALESTGRAPKAVKPKPNLNGSAGFGGNVQSNSEYFSNYPNMQGAAVSELKDEWTVASLVSNVKDVLADLGDGFIEACLEYYNFDYEAVINACLENLLPPSLKKLDKKMPKQIRHKPKQQPKPRPKPKQNGCFEASERKLQELKQTGKISSPNRPIKSDIDLAYEELPEPQIAGPSGRPPQLNRSDSGSREVAPAFSGHSLLADRKNIFDGDKYDVFHRDDVDFSDAHQGVKSVYRDAKNMLDDHEKRELDKERVKQYQYIYDDEYDDTYDERTIASEAVNKDLEAAIEDFKASRSFVTPRVLSEPVEKVKPGWQRAQEEEEEEEEGGRRESRDKAPFVENPEDVRARREAQYQNKRGFRNGNRTFDVKGKSKGEGQDHDVLRNRANKDKHKSSVGNHNRRYQSDRKRAQF